MVGIEDEATLQKPAWHCPISNLYCLHVVVCFHTFVWITTYRGLKDLPAPGFSVSFLPWFRRARIRT